MKAFITGGTGFIGRYVVRLLVQRGDQVYALARSDHGAGVISRLGAIPVPGDITDRESMREAMRGSDMVFHIAAIYDFTPGALAQAEAINVGGTRNVLELAYELDIPRIIYTSSLAVFGDTRGELPDETYYTEGPFPSEYDRTKWKAHYEIAVPLIEQGAPIIIVMPGQVYGPGDNSWLGEMMRLFYRGLLPALPGPETVITLAHAGDIAEGHLLAAEKGRLGESYILAGPAVPLGEMVEFWSQLTGKPAPVIRIPARLARGVAPVAGRVQPALSLPSVFSEALFAILGVTYTGRSDKARAELGWRPRPLQSGMMETFEWIAATEPADAGVREKRAVKALLAAAAALLVLWLWRRKRPAKRQA
jgi:dihydroflavonol-4-reductase